MHVNCTVRKSHAEMDQQMAPFQPQVPSWAIPDDLKSKWNPISRQDSQNEVNLRHKRVKHLLKTRFRISSSFKKDEV